MTTQNWITIVGILLSGLGALYALIRRDIDSMMDAKINKLKQDLQNDRIAHLEKENDALRNRVENTK